MSKHRMSRSGILSQSQQLHEYDDFLDEVFDDGAKQKQIISDTENLVREMDNIIVNQLPAIERHQKEEEELKYTLYDRIDEYRKKRDLGGQNIVQFEKYIQKQSILNQREFIHLQIDKLVDMPKNDNLQSQKWFQDLLVAKLDKLRDSLEILGAKMYKARMTDEIKYSRQRLVNNIDIIIEDVEKLTGAEQKAKLVQLEKGVMELEQYDQIIPQIMADLVNKAGEFCEQLIIFVKEFDNKIEVSLKNIEKSAIQTDQAMKYQYVNIAAQDPNQLRVNRFDIALQNQDLVSIQDGHHLNTKIPLFMIEYFRERNHHQNLEQFQDILVMPSRFFEQLIPPGSVLDWKNMIYKDVKAFTELYSGQNNTIFDKFRRILIGVQPADNGFLLVEIQTRPEREIIIYDAHYNLYSAYHDRIIRCIKGYILEEYRDKTGADEQECIDFSRTFTGRSANCPQVYFPEENGLFFIKNLQLCADGKNVTPLAYRHDTIQKFRLEIFSSLVRIGNNSDRQVQYDVLL